MMKPLASKTIAWKASRLFVDLNHYYIVCSQLCIIWDPKSCHYHKYYPFGIFNGQFNVWSSYRKLYSGVTSADSREQTTNGSQDEPRK